MVDRDLRVAQHEGQRVQPEDGEADGHLAAPARRAGVGTREDGEDDTVPGIVQEPAESGGRRVESRMAAEDVLGVGIGAVLPHEREHGRQVVGTRGACDHTGS